MKTKKDVSTISYNTPEFLKRKLDSLLANHTISDYIFIFHHKEIDEGKDHIHLLIRPNTLLDTMDIQSQLEEFDPRNPEKPLRPIDFRQSKIDEWILYVQHYAPYLAMKFESREYHYQRSDFVYADPDSFEDIYNHAFRGSEFAQRYQVLQALKTGISDPTQLIFNGTIPLNQAANLSAFNKMLQEKTLERSGRSTHTPNES